MSRRVRRATLRAAAVAAAALVVLVQVRASAQGVEPGEVRPELPVPAPPPADPLHQLLPPLPPPPPDAAGVAGGLAVRVDRIEVAGSTVFDEEELAAVVAPWEGRSLTTEDLLAARDAVTDLYVEHGYVTSGALLPDQDLVGGVLVLAVVEGGIGELVVTGNRRFRDAYFAQRLARVAEAPVQVDEVEGALRRLQRDRWIERVDALLEPGDRLGESRLRLVVTETAPWQLHLQGANRRSPTVGSGAGVVEAQSVNVVGMRDVWTLRFEMTEGLRDIESRFEIPVTPWDTRFRFRFRDTDTEIIEKPFAGLDITADARTYGISLFQPVYRGEDDEVWLELTGEHRQTRSRVLGEDFCFELVGPDCDEPTVAVIRIGAEWTRRTRTHAIAFRSLVSIGVDALGATVGDDGSLPDGEFVTWLGQAQWAHVLPEVLLGSLVVLRADAQISDDPLLSIEKFAVGGHQTVRGYRENQLVRDNGVIVSGELRIPLWRDSLRRHRVELVPFMDYGHAWNDGPDPPDNDLWSVGVGLRWMPIEGVLGEVYWGKRLEHVINPHDSLQDHGIYMSLSIDAPAIF